MSVDCSGGTNSQWEISLM